MRKLALMSVVLLAACATQSANMQVGTSQSYLSIGEQREALQAVRIEGEVPSGAKVLGSVDAQRCHRNSNDIEPTDELVTIDLRVTAYARGADGIANVKVQRQSGLLINCWYTLTATAVMFEDP